MIKKEHKDKIVNIVTNEVDMESESVEKIIDVLSNNDIIKTEQFENKSEVEFPSSLHMTTPLFSGIAYFFKQGKTVGYKTESEEPVITASGRKALRRKLKNRGYIF